MSKVALCEVRGLLCDLLDKLSGENWSEWAEILKSLLRKDFSVAELVAKLGGMDGVRRFLAGELIVQAGKPVVKAMGLLKFVREVAVGGAKRFVVADAFGGNNPDGISFYLGGNFQKHFLGKIEEDFEAATIAVHQLERASRDPEIMAELGIEKRVIKLAHFYELIKAQGQGQKGSLLVNGYANIAYIEDESGTSWAVHASWPSYDRAWDVDADSVGRPHEWIAGGQVLSRK